MLKLCGPLITKPLSYLFSNCLRDGVFADDWKKRNVIPAHKKGNKELASNVRSVLLLSISSRMFKRLIFDCISDFF